MNEIWENGFATPINDWIDGFEPGHAKNNGVHANGSNVEGLHVGDPSDGKFKRNFAVGVCKSSAICKAYFNGGAGLDRKAQIGN